MESVIIRRYCSLLLFHGCLMLLMIPVHSSRDNQQLTENHNLMHHTPLTTPTISTPISSSLEASALYNLASSTNLTHSADSDLRSSPPRSLFDSLTLPTRQNAVNDKTHSRNARVANSPKRYPAYYTPPTKQTVRRSSSSNEDKRASRKREPHKSVDDDSDDNGDKTDIIFEIVDEEFTPMLSAHIYAPLVQKINSQQRKFQQRARRRNKKAQSNKKQSAQGRRQRNDDDDGEKDQGGEKRDDRNGKKAMKRTEAHNAVHSDSVMESISEAVHRIASDTEWSPPDSNSPLDTRFDCLLRKAGILPPLEDEEEEGEEDDEEEEGEENDEEEEGDYEDGEEWDENEVAESGAKKDGADESEGAVDEDRADETQGDGDDAQSNKTPITKFPEWRTTRSPPVQAAHQAAVTTAANSKTLYDWVQQESRQVRGHTHPQYHRPEGEDDGDDDERGLLNQPRHLMEAQNLQPHISNTIELARMTGRPSSTPSSKATILTSSLPLSSAHRRLNYLPTDEPHHFHHSFMGDGVEKEESDETTYLAGFDSTGMVGRSVGPMGLEDHPHTNVYGVPHDVVSQLVGNSGEPHLWAHHLDQTVRFPQDAFSLPLKNTVVEQLHTSVPTTENDDNNRPSLINVLGLNNVATSQHSVDGVLNRIMDSPLTNRLPLDGPAFQHGAMMMRAGESSTLEGSGEEVEGDSASHGLAPRLHSMLNIKPWSRPSMSGLKAAQSSSLDRGGSEVAALPCLLGQPLQILGKGTTTRCTV